MLYTNDFAVAAQGAAAAAFREGTAIRPARGPVSTAKDFFAKNVSFLKLLRTFVLDKHILLNIHANGTKQKTRLAVYGRRYRKGRGYFVSEICLSTLRTAFLFINRKSK